MGLIDVFVLFVWIGVGYFMGGYVLLWLIVMKCGMVWKLILIDLMIVLFGCYVDVSFWFFSDEMYFVVWWKWIFFLVDEMIDWFCNCEFYCFFDVDVMCDYCVYGLVLRYDGVEGLELVCVLEIEVSVYMISY